MLLIADQFHRYIQYTMLETMSILNKTFNVIELGDDAPSFRLYTIDIYVIFKPSFMIDN
jgi:hypothetical protein